MPKGLLRVLIKALLGNGREGSVRHLSLSRPGRSAASEALFPERGRAKYESARMKEACQLGLLSPSTQRPLPSLIKGIASLRHMFRLGKLAVTLKRLFSFCFVNRLCF